MTMSDLTGLDAHSFECNKAHADALVRAFSTKKYPRRILVQNEMIVSVKVDDRGFVVHKWTRKIVDLKQVYLVVKDNRKIYQLALEFVETPGDKKPFTDVLQFDPATSRNFTQLISSLRKELLNKSQGREPGQGREREREQSRTSEHADADATSSNSLNPAPYGFTAITSSNRTQSGGSGGAVSKRLAETQAERNLDSGLELEREAQEARASASESSSGFASAIANAQEGRVLAAAAAPGGIGFQPAAPAQASAPTPAFTPAPPSATDPFSNPSSFNPVAASPPPRPHAFGSQTDEPNFTSSPVSTGGDPFNAMMASVNANGHQITTLFTPPPSVGYGAAPSPAAYGAVSDPFAASMAAPAPVSDPFAMGAAPAAAAAAANPFAAAPVSGPAITDPFAQPNQQLQSPPQVSNPYAAAPPGQQQQQVSNPFA
eukprot:CAMPEP_0181354920 /NCGR_PEP_ID=MMETSP1106-20121128/3619_1 /TAXON_ID=81844 /ORGANISM="Mantoniella antarctica, Strain SL-175" /LENGTH=430 /DNA_ID=CAMNT_0023467617 /DNA_START=254 /DNA_END=1546 /DNA_ORIENTATION=+